MELITGCTFVLIELFFFSLVVNKWISTLIASATVKMMKQKDERYMYFFISFMGRFKLALKLVIAFKEIIFVACSNSCYFT